MSGTHKQGVICNFSNKEGPQRSKNSTKGLEAHTVDIDNNLKKIKKYKIIKSIGVGFGGVSAT